MRGEYRLRPTWPALIAGNIAGIGLLTYQQNDFKLRDLEQTYGPAAVAEAARIPPSLILSPSALKPTQHYSDARDFSLLALSLGAELSVLLALQKEKNEKR